MNTMYEIVESLCRKHNISVSALAKEVGISKSTLSELKMGRSQTLSAKNLDKIASYFNVPAGHLFGNEERPAADSDELLKDEFIAFYGDVKSELTPEDLEDIKTLMKLRAEIRRRKE